MADLTVYDTEHTPDTTELVGAAGASRRDALRNGLVAAGLVATAAGVGNRTRSAGPAQPGVHTLSLTTDDLHTDADGVLVPGTPATAYATLQATDGAPVGRFFATHTAIDNTIDDATLAQETHTFVLGDATIIGAGVSTIDDDQHDTFAIIGGTGRYLGARGEYTAIQHHGDFGGDSTATYDMTIIVDHRTTKGN